MTSPLLDLRAFLSLLRRERELVTVDTEVDPDLEAAEVHRRVIAAGGPALLFTRVKGSPWPAVTNLFGTQRRVELAFGKRPLELVQRLHLGHRPRTTHRIRAREVADRTVQVVAALEAFEQRERLEASGGPCHAARVTCPSVQCNGQCLARALGGDVGAPSRSR